MLQFFLVCLCITSCFALANADSPPPCPNTPNCVSSAEAESSPRYIAPLACGLEKNPLARVRTIVEKMPRSSIEEFTDSYLHVTFRSRVFSFVDDVEFFYSPEENCIHVRSAARTGYYDFGVNRRRVEEIRNQFCLE